MKCGVPLMKKINITVIGIGKLGLCFSLILEKHGYKILGVDVDDNYVNSLNNKNYSSSEPDVDTQLRKSNNFVASTDMKSGLNHSDILFILVATPSLSSGKYDHSQINGVIDQLISNSKRNKPKHIVIGCTTMPGYCDKVQERLQPYGYTVSYNPEFIAQGSVMKDLVNPDILLIGEGSKIGGEKIENIYSTILNSKPSIHRMSRKEAEITKIVLNCFLTTKIAYANMVGDIAKSAGCRPDVILEAVGSDSRIGSKNLKYGYGYGGPCFPRDNRAFFLFSDDLDIDAVISKASDTANQMHLKYQLEEFIENNDISKPIVFSDLAYKPGTTIIEESQKLALAVGLAKKGYHIIIQDEKEVMNQIKLIYRNLFKYSPKKKIY